MMFFKCLLFCVLIIYCKGKCTESTKSHSTRCDMYYKCKNLKDSSNRVWVLKSCKQGLVYEHSLSMCVVPDDNWECSLNDIKNDTINKNIEQINDRLYDEHGTSLSEREKYPPINPKNSDDIILVNGDYNENDEQVDDGQDVKIGEVVPIIGDDQFDSDFTYYNYSKPPIGQIDDTSDFSGDGAINVSDTNNKIEVKKDYLAIPLSTPSDQNVATHLQRLSQLIQSLHDSQRNHSQSYDLTPNELNNFLANHNIKNEFDHQIYNTDDKLSLNGNGNIPSEHFNEILELQTRLQHLQNLNTKITSSSSTTTTTTTESSIDPWNEYHLQPDNTRIKLTNTESNSKKFQRVSSEKSGYSTSQIVVNRPEGTVVFSLPATNSQPYTEQSYQQPTYPSTPIPHQQTSRNEPYISEETLKTILELSKQMIQPQRPNSYMGDTNYMQPIFRPVYYNVPIPIISPSGLNSDTNNKKAEHTEMVQKMPVPVTEHSTIIHNHIPITIERPTTSTNKQTNKFTTIKTAESSNNQMQSDKNDPEKFFNSYGDTIQSGGYLIPDRNEYIPYPPTAYHSVDQQNQQNQQVTAVTNPTPLRRKKIPQRNGMITYANNNYDDPGNDEYVEVNYMPADVVSMKQPVRQNPFYYNGNVPGYFISPNQQTYISNPMSKTQSDHPQHQEQPQSFVYHSNQGQIDLFTPSPHLNDDNVNHFIQFNTKYYPTIRPYDGYGVSSNVGDRHQINAPNRLHEPITGSISMPTSTIRVPMTHIQYGDQDRIENHDQMNVEMLDGNEDITNYDVNNDANSNYDSDDSGNMNDQSAIFPADVITLLANQLKDTQLQSPLTASYEFNSNVGGGDLQSKSGDGQYFGESGDNRRQVVNLGGSIISYEAYENSVAPLLQNPKFGGGIEVLQCTTGVRQPNSTDCTRYYVCNSGTGRVLSYICPPFTGFNAQSRLCDAKTYADCNPTAIKNQVSIDSNKRLQAEALTALYEANQIKNEAIRTQNMANLIKQQAENLYNRPKPVTFAQTAQIIRPIYRKPTPFPSIPPSINLRPHTTTAGLTGIISPAQLKKTKIHSNKPRIRRIPCKQPGKIPDSLSVNNYFLCFKGSDNIMRARKMTCPSELMFCPSISLCTIQTNCR